MAARTMAAALVPALLMLGAAPGVAQETVLRGEVLLRDGQPATGVRLVVVGHPPEVAVRDGGLFTHALSGAPSEVTVRVVGQPPAELLYPPAGRVVVPRDPAAVVSIVVGERIGTAVEQRIQRDIDDLHETLLARGVSEAEIEGVVQAELDGLVPRIAALIDTAVGGAVSGAARVELRERVNRHLGTYARRSRDLVDAFDLVDVTRPFSLSESLILRDAIGNYNDAFGELDRELGEAPAALEQAWPGDEGRALRDRMAGILALIRGELHPEMLALREPLVVIQRNFTSDPPGRQQVDAARQAVSATLPRLRPVVERLEADVPGLMAELRP